MQAAVKKFILRSIIGIVGQLYYRNQAWLPKIRTTMLWPMDVSTYMGKQRSFGVKTHGARILCAYFSVISFVRKSFDVYTWQRLAGSWKNVKFIVTDVICYEYSSFTPTIRSYIQYYMSRESICCVVAYAIRIIFKLINIIQKKIAIEYPSNA